MSYTLAAAAAATGLSKATLLRAIKDGSINARKDGRGQWRVEPAELHRVYPPIAQAGAAAERREIADIDALGAQIEALLRQAGDRLRRQLDDVRRDAGHRPLEHARTAQRSDA